MRTAEPPGRRLTFFCIPLHLLLPKPRFVQMPLHCGLFQNPWRHPSFQLQNLYDLAHAALWNFPFQLHCLLHHLIKVIRQPLHPLLCPAHWAQPFKAIVPIPCLIPVKAPFGYAVFFGGFFPHLPPFPFIQPFIQQRRYHTVPFQRFLILPLFDFFFLHMHYLLLEITIHLKKDDSEQKQVHKSGRLRVRL